MSILDLSQVPNYVVMELVGNTAIYSSALTGAAQTVDRGGFHWSLAYTFTALRNDDRADLLGTIVGLRSQANRLRIPVYDNPKRGAYGGTPLVAGASQTGSSIDLDGCSVSVTNWIRKGDYFSIDVNGEHELKMASDDASSDATGAITIPFEPRLRASPLDNAAVFVEDGVLSKPNGIFVLGEPNLQWSSRPGSPNKTTAVTITATEDMFATQ